MFSFQASQIQDRALRNLIGNCAQPLEHRSSLDLKATFPDGATRGALDVYSYRQGGGDGAYGIAGRFFGDVEITGRVIPTVNSPGIIPIGGLMPFYGTVAEMNAIIATGYWALCDGTNGTPDLGDKFIGGYKSGGTFGTIGGTGGAASHQHGSDTTGAGGTGDTGAASGNTASATTGITASSPGHTHTVSFGTTNINSAAMGSPLDVVTSIAGADATVVTVNISDSGHAHGLGSHVHSGPSHTHTVPASDSQSNYPPYITLAWLIRIA